MRKIVKTVAGTLLATQLFASAGIAGDGPRYMSSAWWAQRSADPPGTRQVEKYGKLWPPYARPTGPEQTWLHKYHHAHYWPHPYNCEDRAIVNSAFAAQAGAGWAQATTLHSYHFSSDTQELNSAGQSLLYWIITSAPPQYRTIYVAPTSEPAIDALRMSKLQLSTEQLAGTNIPQILMRHALPTQRPAGEIDRLRQMELQTMPRPRLNMSVQAGGQAQQQGGSSGGGGSGGGAAGGAGTAPR